MRRALIAAGALAALAGTAEATRAADERRCPQGEYAIDTNCTHPRTGAFCSTWLVVAGEQFCGQPRRAGA